MYTIDDAKKALRELAEPEVGDHLESLEEDNEGRWVEDYHHPGVFGFVDPAKPNKALLIMYSPGTADGGSDWDFEMSWDLEKWL